MDKRKRIATRGGSWHEGQEQPSMLKGLANKAPFKVVRIDGVDARPGHKHRLWQAKDYTKFIVDKDGLVTRILREEVDAEAMADEMNTRAAMTIMTDGTPADPNWNSDMWEAYKP